MGQDKNLKCTGCKSFRFCRTKSVSKGSATCARNRGTLAPKVIPKEVSEGSKKAGLLWRMFGKGKKNDEVQ